MESLEAAFPFLQRPDIFWFWEQAQRVCHTQYMLMDGWLDDLRTAFELIDLLA